MQSLVFSLLSFVFYLLLLLRSCFSSSFLFFIFSYRYFISFFNFLFFYYFFILSSIPSQACSCMTSFPSFPPFSPILLGEKVTFPLFPYSFRGKNHVCLEFPPKASVSPQLATGFLPAVSAPTLASPAVYLFICLVGWLAGCLIFYLFGWLVD